MKRLTAWGHPAALPGLFLTLATAAHSQVVGGTISGVITDPAGAVVPNATIRVHNNDTGLERRLITDSNGRYSAPSIPVGSYVVEVTAEGFTTGRRVGISLAVGQSIAANFQLTVSSAEEQVVVSDAPPSIDLSTEETSGLITERQVKDLPLNGRSYDQLITLNPATVNYTSQRSGSIGTSNSSVGNMFSVSGRRPQDNIYLLNGVEYTGASLINLTPGGTSGQLLGVDAVREFNVLADTYGANYGKRQGAQISIVTASGTNMLHGSVYEFLRNSALDARNYFDQGRIPNFQRNNFGAALGGPLRANKLFLFGNYEGYRQNLGITDVTLVPDNNARAGLLANGAGATKPVTLGPGVANLLKLWPVQNGPELLNSNGFATGIGLAFSNPTQHIREDFGTARFDANLSANDLLFAVVTIDDSTAQTPTQNPLSRIDEALREQVWSVQEQHVFSPRLLNTARFGFSRAGFLFQGDVPADVSAASGTFVPGKPIGAVVVAGSTASNGSSQLTGAGSNVGSDNTMARNLFTGDDHLFITFGRHQIDAGGWVQRLQSNDNLAQNQFGQASFASLATLLSGTIKTFTVVPTPTPLNWRSWFGASYLQDTWKPTSRLELTGGLRTESTNGFNEAHGRAGIYKFTGGVIQTNPTVGTAALPQNRAKFLLEPRAGFAWDLSGHGTTSLRGAIGLHHSLLDNLDYRLDQAAPYNTTLTYSGVPVAAPTAGAPGLISPSTVQTDLWTPTVLAWDLKVEQQLAPATSLTLAYIGSHATHQILSSDLNEPGFVVCENNCPAGVPNGTAYYPTVTKGNTAVANTTSWTSGGTANYNGLVVDVRHSLKHGLQLRGNYTFSKNLDDGSAWNTSVSSNTPAYVSVPSLSHQDYGRAATDVRQLAAINGSYDLPFGHDRALLSASGPALDRAVGGWTVASIVTVQTGLPFSPQLGYNPTGSGDTRNPVRPNLNPNFHGSVYTHGTTAQRAARYFNPAAFTAPVGGAVGNLGRDTLTGPGFADWDLSLLKETPLTERTRLQFRTEVFNLLNHTNLLTPNPVVFASGPTQGATASRTAAAVESPTAGVVTAAATSRQIQFGLKLLF